MRSSYLSLYFLLVSPLTLYFHISDIELLMDWSLCQVGRTSLNFTVILDKISLRFRMLVCLISSCVIIFCQSYISHEKFLTRFRFLVLAFVLSINFLIFIPRVPALLLGWDGLGLTSFLLVVYYQNYKSLAAGILTIIMNRIGDVFIILAVALLVTQGHWNLFLFWPDNLRYLVIIFLIVSAMTKRAQVPFSSWLPAAMAAPTPVSALVHSSTLVTAGVYLLIRFHYFFSQYEVFRKLLLFFSGLTLLMAGIRANIECDLKKVIALSTLRQLGLIIFSLALNKPLLALFHLYIHALFKALLFLCAGIIIHYAHNSQDIRSIGIFSRRIPLIAGCINVGSFALCGIPFIRGFYSKDLILERALVSSTNLVFLALLMFATGLTASYTFRLSVYSLWRKIKGQPLSDMRKLGQFYIIPVTVLAVMSIASGWAMQILMFDFVVLVIVPFNLKILTPLVIISGFTGGAILWKWHYKSKNFSLIKHFSVQIWFLTLISSHPFSVSVILGGTNVIKALDQGWREILGGQGLFSLNINLRQALISVQLKTFNCLIMLVFRAVLYLSVINYFYSLWEHDTEAVKEILYSKNDKII